MEHVVESIIRLDHDLFFIINGAHSPLLDPVMKVFSNIPVWIPLYLLIAGGLFILLPWKKALIAIGGIWLTFLLTDQISSSLIKEWVQRIRPCHVPDWEGRIHLLEGKGGLYSFVSSHAANVFGLTAFTSLVYRKKWYSMLLFLWAILVSYSRIYVGKHFPADVLCGALAGMLLGWIVYKIYSFVVLKIEKHALPDR
jgi:undecaprenyl-diphosphatase